MADAGTIGAGVSTAGIIQIGCLIYASTRIGYFDGKIQAIAFYDTPLTVPQVAAITAAMNALP